MESVTSTTHKDEGVITYKKGQQNNYDVTSMRTGRQSSNHFECKICSKSQSKETRQVQERMVPLVGRLCSPRAVPCLYWIMHNVFHKSNEILSLLLAITSPSKDRITFWCKYLHLSHIALCNSHHLPNHV